MRPQGAVRSSADCDHTLLRKLMNVCYAVCPTISLKFSAQVDRLRTQTLKLLSTWKIPCLSVPPTKHTAPPLLGQSAQLHCNIMDHLLFFSSSLRALAISIDQAWCRALSLLCATRFRFNHTDGVTGYRSDGIPAFGQDFYCLVHHNFLFLFVSGDSLSYGRDGSAVITLGSSA